MRIAIVVITLAATTLSAQTPRTAQQEIEHVAAFARLYGVVRYFYPGDAGVTVDWNRFAVHGAARVRRATDAATLETAMRELFTPLGPGIEIGRSLPPPPAIGAADPTLIAWRYTGPGGMSLAPGPYTAGRTNRAAAVPMNPAAFTAFAQVIPAAPHRGKTIRLRARVRVTNPDAGAAGLWLRVDRPNQARGFFDNMQDRPVRSAEWREYEIQGQVAADAISIVAGLLTNGAVTAEYDGFELAVLDGATWTAIPMPNAGFEEVGSRAVPESWQRMGSAPSPRVTVESGDAAEGTRFLRVTAVPSGTGTTSAAAPVAGAAPRNAYSDVDLGSGLRARVRLSLTDAEARTPGAALDGLMAAVSAISNPQGRSDADVRLADVVVAWNVLRHFYPYWTETGVDWDSRLRPQLALAGAAADRTAQRDALRQLIAEARDGHGNVVDAAFTERRALLPLQLFVIEGRLVVTGSTVPDQVPVGSIVSAVSGKPAAERLEEGMLLNSGTAQWRQSRALRDMLVCTRDVGIPVSLQPPAGPAREVVVLCNAAQLVAEERPNAMAESRPGIWYVDLTRVTAAQLTPALPSLALAKGIVFDLRGYPTDAGVVLLRHLIDKPENDRWMHVPRITRPFGQVESWQSVGWNLQPATPQLPRRRIFLTDGRAISYAESVMGYVKDRQLATIIGGPTAGTNGNIVTFTTPGGFAITFTGMRVTGHDGRAQHHMIGIAPDIRLEPTLAGVRAGRDELLERALAHLQNP
jgi:hypothetical protein